MLKKLSVIIAITMLVACTSQPVEKGFTGTGDFDRVEAAKTRVSLGLTYLKNGNFSQAKFNLDKALEFNPRSGQANYAMAFYYQQVDENERAHEYFKKAISLSQDDPDILNSYGAFLCKQGDYDEAKRLFLEAVDDKSYVSTAETYENLAICSESQGKVEEAITYFNSALNHQPTRATSLLYLSQLYTQTGQWDLAKKSLWKYERNASVNADSLWLSFQIAQGQGDLPASAEYVALLKRLFPDSPNTAKAKALVGRLAPDMTVTQKRRSVSQGPGGIVATSEQKSEAVNPVDVQSSVEVEQPASLVEEVDDTSSAVNLDSTDDIVNNAGRPFHIVRPKENLYRISLKYNVKVIKLLEWNEIDDASSISIGTKLWVGDPKTNE